jgi:hypothetical protein
MVGYNIFRIVRGFFMPSLESGAVYKVSSSPGGQKNQTHFITGYILHYLAGLIFSICYKFFWDRRKRKPGYMNSLIGGFINGIFGVGIWHTLFKAIHRPWLGLKKYYLQLIIAHIIFGFINGVIYRKKISK